MTEAWGFVQAHYDELCVIFASAYVAARGIVYLTPTPTDDKYLDRVHWFVLGAAKIFGLTLKQGTKMKTPDKFEPPTTRPSASGGTTTVAPKKVAGGTGRIKAGMILFAGALLAYSCVTAGVLQDNPRAELRAAQETFNGLVDALTIMRTSGKFTIEEADQLTVVIAEGDQYLTEWEDAVIQGLPRPGTANVWAGILARLNELKGDVEIKPIQSD